MPLGKTVFNIRQSLIHSPGPPFLRPWVIGYFACSSSIPSCFHLGAEQLFCLPRATSSKGLCSVSCCFAAIWFRKLPLPYRTIKPPQPSLFEGLPKHKNMGSPSTQEVAPSSAMTFNLVVL